MINRIFLTFFIIISFEAFSLEVTLTQGSIKPTPIAITQFFADDTNLEKVGKNISNIISNNLERSGLFLPLDKKAFIQDVKSLSIKPRFEDWKIIKAQHLVAGQISKSNNKIVVSFKLYDVYQQKLLETKFKGALSGPETSWRRIAHMISDSIYQKITGEGGYFDTRVIYVSEEGPKTARVKKLAIMDQDGFNTKYLTLGNELVLTPRFNPTNQMVTYMSYFRNMPRVYLLDIETGTQEVVGNFPGMTFAPRFSPDGKKIIMSFAKDGNSDIYTMDLESRLVERITEHSSIDTSPSFSPDGKFIAFNSDRSGLQQIYVMRSDGSKVKRITFGKGIYGTPVWSPRGDLIAFTKMHKGRFYIGVMRIDGTGERLLTENYYQEAPSWSPNGRVLVFYRETKAGEKGEGFSAKLWSIDITGYNERKLSTKTDASDPSWSSLLSK